MLLNKKRKLSILGCGWLGLPLAIRLNDNFDIKASTTSKNKLNTLSSFGINPYLINLNPTTEIDVSFFDSEILIICIPPRVRTKGEQFHIKQMECLIPYIENSKIQHIIYTSSTSIYPSLSKELDESFVLTSENNGNKTLFEVENILRNNLRVPTTILRLAGLYGLDRTLIKHFVGRKGLTNGKTPVNLVFQDDVVSCIEQIILQNRCNKLYNICADKHPTRKAFYEMLASKSDYEAPHYEDTVIIPAFKVISNVKIKRDLNFEFKYSDPLNFPI